MANYAMLIDLGKCVGCSACQIACKIQNGVGEGVYYSHHEIKTSGTFPKTTYRYIPTMCNHCENATCVNVCPVGAMYKQDGLTLHDDDKCIGCTACVHACPYKWPTIRSVEEYSRYTSDAAIIDGVSATGAEVSEAAGATSSILPFSAASIAKDGELKYEGKSQKCTFCHTLIESGSDPYCVHMCPASARMWGDVDDATSDISKALKDADISVSHPEYGTNPHVYYIGTYGKS
jgi:molybdopterin-containing oxidoreductase family iron-sulfur binding subunit